MKLHCLICSYNATRPNQYSEVAVIDEEKIGLPLDGSMFKPLNPERGIVGPPWVGRKDVKWDRMLHYAHSPFALSNEESMQAMKDGGPRRLYVGEGWIEIGEGGIIRRSGNTQVYECPKCGKVFDYADPVKNRMAFLGHLSGHRRAEKKA